MRIILSLFSMFILYAATAYGEVEKQNCPKIEAKYLLDHLNDSEMELLDKKWTLIKQYKDVDRSGTIAALVDIKDEPLSEIEITNIGQGFSEYALNECTYTVRTPKYISGFTLKYHVD